MPFNETSSIFNVTDSFTRCTAKNKDISLIFGAHVKFGAQLYNAGIQLHNIYSVCFDKY